MWKHILPLLQRKMVSLPMFDLCKLRQLDRAYRRHFLCSNPGGTYLNIDEIFDFQSHVQPDDDEVK